MENCFSNCCSSSDDDYHRLSSPVCSGPCRPAGHILPTAGTNSSKSSLNPAVTPSGHHGPSSPMSAGTPQNTPSKGSVIVTPSGHHGPSSLMSAETPQNTPSKRSVIVTPSGHHGPSSPMSAGTPQNTPTKGSVIVTPSGHHSHDTCIAELEANNSTDDRKINLSSFTLHHILGQGSFGTVVLATHKKSQQKVAIKSVKKTEETYDIDVEWFALKKSESCPFITQLYANFQTRYSAFFVMEYVCGGDLCNFIWNNAPADYESIRFIVAQISCGLEHLHDHGILHRDIKPENILMDNKGHIRITDFGLAVAGLYYDKITTGMAGTRSYMAPEIINNDIYQFELGWFSLGVVTYLLATRQMPFASRTMDEYRN